ncbi:methyl-accepting chemotaxis protein [Nitrobacter sp. NHB1]|uniref:methyl-accepting chemotaxis protein n=1 Tax=Nitrobacter sp. NHB1 TaxID=3119830 RepID=UPI003000E5CD
MLSRLSIRAKIISIISFLLLAMAGMGVLSLLEMESIHANATDIRTNWLPSVRELGELRANTMTYEIAVHSHLLAADAAGKDAAEKTLDTVGQAINKTRKAYEAMMTSPEEGRIYNEFSEQWASYVAGVRDLLAVSRKGDVNARLDVNNAKVNQIGLKADETLRKAIELNNKGADAAGHAASRSYNSAFTIVVVIASLALIIGIGIGIYLVRDISRAIASIVAPMRKLGAGDLSAAVPHQGEKTEVGTMADALQVFKTALIAKKAADEAAAHDADAKLRRAQRVDTITGQFESMIGELVGSLSSSSTELEAAANTLTTTAEATGRTSGEAAAASQEVSSNVQSVASATEEITSSVHEISRQVQEASRVAGDAVRQAEKTDTSIAELSQAAARIGDVVKLITAVAEQTNLLALNATIEAARAGDAGRGFAVVASEVKALAAQTAKATDEIGTQIAGMQSATRDSVAAIREIGTTIKLISEISSTIAAAVEEQGAATQEISRNVQHAAQRSGEVASSITEVSRGAGETGSASSQVLSSAQMLSTESTRLKTEVETFLHTVRAA